MRGRGDRRGKGDTEAILSCHFSSLRRVIMSGTSKALLDLAGIVFPRATLALGMMGRKFGLHYFFFQITLMDSETRKSGEIAAR